jgi:ribosomal protein S10
LSEKLGCFDKDAKTKGPRPKTKKAMIYRYRQDLNHEDEGREEHEECFLERFVTFASFVAFVVRKRDL